MKTCLPYVMPALPENRRPRDCAQVATLILCTNNGVPAHYNSLFTDEYTEELGTPFNEFVDLLDPYFELILYDSGKPEHLIAELCADRPVAVIMRYSEYHVAVLVGVDSEKGLWRLMDESGMTTLPNTAFDSMWTGVWLKLRKKHGVVESGESGVWSDIFTTRSHMVSDDNEGYSGEYPWA